MRKEFRCISRFMPQPHQVTWSTLRAQQSTKVEAAAGIGACDNLCMLSYSVTGHLASLVPMVKYFM